MLLLLLVGAGVGFRGDLFVSPREASLLREQREALSARVERLQTELAVESATRHELERQAAVLNAQVAELTGQVEFLRARRAPAHAAK